MFYTLYYYGHRVSNKRLHNTISCKMMFFVIAKKFQECTCISELFMILPVAYVLSVKQTFKQHDMSK